MASPFWTAWPGRGEARRKCALHGTGAHPPGSLREARLLLQNLSQFSVPKPCWYSRACFLLPARLTLGLSYQSSLKLAAPVSCHINCELRSRTYVMSYQSQRSKAPQVGVLAPAASLPNSSGCLRNDRSPLCIGSGSARVEIRCANAAELGSLTGAAENLCTADSL